MTDVEELFPAPPPGPQCPHCQRTIALYGRLSGDELVCPCGARLAIWFRPGGRTEIETVEPPARRGLLGLQQWFPERPGGGRLN